LKKRGKKGDRLLFLAEKGAKLHLHVSLRAP
jgi:hypothetical protein